MRAIDADHLKRWIISRGLKSQLHPADIIDQIDRESTIEPEIVQCKDCKWKQGSECVRFAEVRPFPDDFCSRAERRTDG